MKILSVNAGSSSLKFQAYEMPEETVLVSGVFERIGLDGSFYTIKYNGQKDKKTVELPNHEVAVQILIQELMNYHVIESLDEIKGVGHRLVHGGDKYSKSVVIDDTVIQTVEDLSPLAPIHNPANLMGVRAFINAIPNATQVGCFDTAFHQTMEEDKYLYAVPREWYEKYGVRKYGFHGMSHHYVSNKMASMLGKEHSNIIVCHLGNGGSISAVKDGRCVDTTMGFTPNAGIVMGSRCGDIDYSMIPYMMEKTGMSIAEMDHFFNKKSGVLGISGISSDFRDIEDKMAENDSNAVLAFNMFVNSVVGYLAKYYVTLGHVDAICFTAGVGENSPLVREAVLKKLECLGIQLDEEKNDETRFGKEGCITKESSSVPCYVIPTNEEVMIARDTYQFIK